jgi:hypothetical protein
MKTEVRYFTETFNLLNPFLCYSSYQSVMKVLARSNTFTLQNSEVREKIKYIFVDIAGGSWLDRKKVLWD